MQAIPTNSLRGVFQKALISPRNRTIMTSFFRRQHGVSSRGIRSLALFARVTPHSSRQPKLHSAFLVSSAIGYAFATSSTELHAATIEKTPLEVFVEEVNSECAEVALDTIKKLNQKDIVQALEYMDENDLKNVYTTSFLYERKNKLFKEELKDVIDRKDIPKLDKIIKQNPKDHEINLIFGFLKEVFFGRGNWDPEIAKRLISVKESPYVITYVGAKNPGEYYSYLHSVFENYRNNPSMVEKIQVLLQNGANPNASYAGGTTPLHKAIDCYYKVDRFSQYDPNLNVKEVKKQLLHCIHELVSFGADLNQEDQSGNTPFSLLMEKIPNNDFSTALYFLENGADKDGRTTLYRICSMKNAYSIAEFLLENGANPNFLTDEELSPAVAAAFKEDESLLQLLVNHGANLAIAIEGCRRIVEKETAAGNVQNARMFSAPLNWLEDRRSFTVKRAE